MINKDRTFFQYNSGDLLYIKYVGLVVVYKKIDPHNYVLMTLDGKTSRGLFEHERLKPANIRTSQGNVNNLVQLKQIMNARIKV